MGALDQKVAIIPDGTSRIGGRTARLFVEEGAAVVVAGRRGVEGEQIAQPPELRGDESCDRAAQAAPRHRPRLCLLGGQGGLSVFRSNDAHGQSGHRRSVTRTQCELGCTFAFVNGGTSNCPGTSELPRLTQDGERG